MLTFDSMLLQRSNLFERKAERIDHKDAFRNIDGVEFMPLECEDEEDEEDKEAGERMLSRLP